MSLAATKSECDVHVKSVVESCVNRIFGYSVACTMPLVSAGIDSIQAIELTRVLSEQLNTNLPATLLFDHPSTAAIVAFIQ